MGGFWEQVIGPRSWFRMFLSAHGWGAVLLAIATVFCTAVSISFYGQARTVEQDGVDTWATVISRRVEGAGPHKTYFVTYGVTHDGESQQVEMQVGGDAYADAAFPLQQIRYRTDNPVLIDKQRQQHLAQARRFQTFAFWAGLIGLIAGWLSGRRATAALLARRWGVEEDAYVTRRVVSYSSKSPPSVHIRFRSHSGVEGRSFTRSSLTFPDVDRGEFIPVFVHRGRAWWIYDTGPRPTVSNRMPSIARKVKPLLRPSRNRHGS